MLNKNLTKIRKERGLTQEALAVKLNVVRQTVSKWENGTAVPDADTLCRIAGALDVSVSALLGEELPEPREDSSAVVKALAQINEQLAVRNRRAVTMWKLICFVLLIAVGVLIGRLYYGDAPEALPTDKIEISNVCFNGDEKTLICSFVPSIGRDDFVYTVTLYSHDSAFHGATAEAMYENGVCTAAFDKDGLSPYVEYSVVLSVNCGDSVCNLTLADCFNFRENGYSWQSWD